jgi:hypothetical protein
MPERLALWRALDRLGPHLVDRILVKALGVLGVLVIVASRCT